MNAQEALTKFVSDNFANLTSEELSLQDLRKIQRLYYQDKLRNKHSRPSNRDIAMALLRVMERRGLSRSAINNYIEFLPIFGLAGETLREELLNSPEAKTNESAINAEDLEIIRSVGAYEAVLQVVGRDAEQQKQSELRDLDDEIAKKRQEYDALPSLLDIVETVEPDFDPAVDDVRPWWERFYLRGDPFPRKDGLSDVDKSLYEAVIVKTTPFTNVLSALQRNPEYLFHTAFLLVGDFGYGKTTFIDYLSNFLINSDILPIRILPTRPCADSTGYTDQFFLKLRDELSSEATSIGMLPPTHLSPGGPDDHVLQLARMVTERRWKGIVVFLDDYHKHRPQLKHVYEFLGYLQIIKDLLTRAGVNVGFFVSGTPDWKAELQRNGQMAGFLDNTPIEMPAITPELVCEVFNQRIRAYCYDKSPRSIRLDFVRLVFKETDAMQGFRQYITRITTELSNNNLAIIDTPINLDETTLASIKTDLETDLALRSSLNKLVYESKFQRYTQQQVVLCLELLIQTALQQGVNEADRLFLDNKFYFTQLRDVSLIQKARASKSQGTAWKIHTRLERATASIRERHGYGIADYLLKIYGRKSYERPSLAIDDMLPARYREVRAFLTSSDTHIQEGPRKNIELAVKAFDATVLAEQDGRSNAESVKRGVESLEYISNAMFELDNSRPYFQRVGITDLEIRWQTHWLQDEGIAETFRRISACNTNPQRRQYDLALKQLRDTFPVIAEHTQTVIQAITGVVPICLLSRSFRHTTEELGLFDQIREQYGSAFGHAHFDYVRKLTDYLERRMRWFLYACSSLVFGEAGYVAELPEAVRKYAFKNFDDQTTYSAVSNKYEGFTRPQFRSVFTTGSRLKDMVVDPIPISWNTADWTLFFDLFVEENIKTAHQKLSMYDQSERDRYFSYCRLAEELTAHVNEMGYDIVARAYVLMPNQDSSPQDMAVKFFLKRPKSDDVRLTSARVLGEPPLPLSKELPVSHAISGALFSKVMDQVIANINASPTASVVEDLYDVEYLATHYAVTYQDFLSAIVMGWRVMGRIVVHRWFGSAVMIKLPTSSEPILNG